MKMWKNLQDKKWLSYAAAACVAVVLFVALTHLTPIGMALKTLYGYIKPIVIGVVLAYVVNPIANLFENKVFKNMKAKKAAHILSVSFAFLFILLVIVILIVALVPQLIDSVTMFASNIDTYVSGFNSFYGNIIDIALRWNIDLTHMLDRFDNILTDMGGWITENYTRILSTSYGIGMVIVNTLIGFILSIYFLIDKDRIVKAVRRFTKALVKEQKFVRICDFCAKSHRILIRYIICDCVDGLLVGVVNGIFMVIMQYPYAVLISVIVGVTNLAPTFGPIFGALIGGFVLLLADPVAAIVFIVFTLVLQVIDGYVIKPKLFGETLGIPSFLILIAIIIGGNIFGVIGIVLSIPVAAILLVVYDEIILPRLENSPYNEGEDA